MVSEPAFVDGKVGIVEPLPKGEHRCHGFGLGGVLALAFARIAA
jgi:hypothetical protein